MSVLNNTPTECNRIGQRYARHFHTFEAIKEVCIGRASLGSQLGIFWMGIRANSISARMTLKSLFHMGKCTIFVSIAL